MPDSTIPDTGPAAQDAQADAFADSSVCTTDDLAHLGTYLGCPVYSPEAGPAELCGDGGARAIDVESGGGLTVLSFPGFNFVTSQCIYNASDRTLVGALAWSDAADFCNGTSDHESAGMQAPQGVQTTTLSCSGTSDAGPDSATTPVACCCEGDELSNPDAGADGGLFCSVGSLHFDQECNASQCGGPCSLPCGDGG